jgi:hypothetical protein
MKYGFFQKFVPMPVLEPSQFVMFRREIEPYAEPKSSNCNSLQLIGLRFALPSDGFPLTRSGIQKESRNWNREQLRCNLVGFFGSV